MWKTCSLGSDVNGNSSSANLLSVPKLHISSSVILLTIEAISQRRQDT